MENSSRLWIDAGAGRGIRTPDQRFTKPLRYHYAIPANENGGIIAYLRADRKSAEKVNE